MKRNKKGQMIVYFSKRIVVFILNTYFIKKEEHRVMYQCDG